MAIFNSYVKLPEGNWIITPVTSRLSRGKKNAITGVKFYNFTKWDFCHQVMILTDYNVVVNFNDPSFLCYWIYSLIWDDMT